MSRLANEVQLFWQKNLVGYAGALHSFECERYPAWAVCLSDGRWGVAVPYPGECLIRERFASVWLESLEIPNISSGRTLVLSSYENTVAFASFCADFVDPGPDGKYRLCLIDDPVAWWEEWKELLGNVNSDKRTYDVLGELISLEVLSTKNRQPVWRGPDGATCDIDCGMEKFEIKSTLSRNSKNVQVHGLFQLASDGSKKYLIYAQFEASSEGESIDGVVDRLCLKGFSRMGLNVALENLGYPVGSSSRTQCYKLLGLTQYYIDASFPHIALNSFVGGKLPAGVTGLDYGISLDGIEGLNLLDAFGDDASKAE